MPDLELLGVLSKESSPGSRTSIETLRDSDEVPKQFKLRLNSSLYIATSPPSRRVFFPTISLQRRMLTQRDWSVLHALYVLLTT